MPLISIVMTIALLLTLGSTGYFTMQPVCADDDPAAEIFSCDEEPLISSIEYSGEKSLLGGTCPIPKCSCKKIGLTKTGPEKATVGEEITYEYQVTNNHSCTSLRDVSILDNKLGSINVAATLGPNKTEDIKVKYTIKDTDKPGPLVNDATVTGYHFWDCQHWFPITCSAKWSVTITDPDDPKPSIKLLKTADLSSAKVGDKVTYTYTITNNGQTPLTKISLTDDKKTDNNSLIDLTKTELAIDESTTATWTYTILSADPNPVVNKANAKGTYNGTEVNSPASASVAIQTTPSSGASIKIVKTANEWIRVPGTINYLYKITNDGKLPLTDLTLYDDKLGSIVLPDTNLAVDGSMQVTTDKTIKDTDYSDWTKVGMLENKATVTAKWTAGTGSQSPIDSSDTAEVLLFNPKLSVVKTADLSSADTGQTIHYNYTVRNNGNAPLHDVTLYDGKLGAVTLTASTLAIGAEATGTASFKVLSTTPRGDLTNIATAKGFYNEPGTEQKEGFIEATATKTVQINSPYHDGGGGGGGSSLSARITVDKTADRTTATVGDKITYTYKIKNSGDYSFSKVELDDNKLGKKTLGALNTGDSTTITETYTVKDSDPVGDLKNIVTVTGFFKNYGNDNQVTATDETVVGITTKPEAITAAPEVQVAEPIVVPPEPQADLPYTGGDSLAFGLIGVVMICAGIALSRRLTA